jgi:hypothetical protein
LTVVVAARLSGRTRSLITEFARDTVAARIDFRAILLSTVTILPLFDKTVLAYRIPEHLQWCDVIGQGVA